MSAMQIVPTYIVTWAMPTDGHTHEVTYRVPETSLDAFLKVLRFNGCTSFAAKLDS